MVTRTPKIAQLRQVTGIKLPSAKVVRAATVERVFYRVKMETSTLTRHWSRWYGRDWATGGPCSTQSRCPGYSIYFNKILKIIFSSQSGPGYVSSWSASFWLFSSIFNSATQTSSRSAPRPRAPRARPGATARNAPIDAVAKRDD